MQMVTWGRNVNGISALLKAVSIWRGEGIDMDCDEGFSWWAAQTSALRAAGGTVFLVGNGASASMASHLAADLAKNAHVHTEVFSDLSLITAISNDMGYDQVFVEPLRRRGRRGDMLVAISSSGRSENILKSVETGGQMGLTVVTLSGMDSDNPLRTHGDLNVYISGKTYGEVETCHAAVLHYWMDLVQHGSAEGAHAGGHSG